MDILKAIEMTFWIIVPFAALFALLIWAAKGGLVINTFLCVLAFACVVFLAWELFSLHWTRSLFWHNGGKVVTLFFGVRIAVFQWRRVAELHRQHHTSIVSDGHGG